ncbi:MAG: hypothetical protein M1829_005251 [Trizodia sp. TS-e1964]|nr:MAG: hypothetical protein M1829_005251 [Trizodia sp. TS-e1964]
MRSSPSAQQRVYFTPGRTSRTICIIGLVACWIICLGFLLLGILVHRRGSSLVSVSGISRGLVPLAINILVTAFNEVLGYIHGISLRWALFKEGRLAFSSNPRLLSSVKTSTSVANTWYINVLMLLALIVSYSSTPLILLGDSGSSSSIPNREANYSHASGLAIITCATALLFQALVASWCLFSGLVAPTWSSDPLDVAAACISLSPGLRRVPGRCMLSVHDAARPSDPTIPRDRQGSAYRANIRVNKCLRWLWGLVAEGVLFGTVMLVVTKGGTGTFGTNWSVFPRPDAPAGNIGWAIDYKTLAITDSTLVRGLAIFSAFQALLTLTTHCSELIVSCSRDESLWRTAGKPAGLKRDTNSIVQALSSWQTMLLLVAKPIMHWMYGLAVSAWFQLGIHIEPVQLFYLAIMALSLTFIMIYTAHRKPYGPQPATYGHLQTIINLVDQWPAQGQRLYWGHSGFEHGIAHAGTSGNPLGEIIMDDVYMGLSIKPNDNQSQKYMNH